MAKNDEKYVFVKDELDPLLKEIQGLFKREDSQIAFISLKLLLIPNPKHEEKTKE